MQIHPHIYIIYTYPHTCTYMSAIALALLAAKSMTEEYSARKQGYLRIKFSLLPKDAAEVDYLV